MTEKKRSNVKKEQPKGNKDYIETTQNGIIIRTYIKNKGE